MQMEDRGESLWQVVWFKGLVGEEFQLARGSETSKSFPWFLLEDRESSKSTWRKLQTVTVVSVTIVYRETDLFPV